ncbi:MAG: nicotinamide-nucleotide adenylyltransferase [Candidatus Thorarchaeota archaeon]|nr:MAG: nicotinamide-nucleotide adenylyltransferase [Candidatus Thorarchaeota archaeon]RLI59678.1 MAG: nicotinamide-nucleotide adenylyltransferase [Candidatus Thorarchaeota archaeon]
MKSLFIGRFQPIHKGHIHTIKQILAKNEDIIIVVGSSQYSHTPDNPFTGGERVMFIRRALLDEGISLERVCIIPLSDINIHPLWVSHMRSFVPYFDKAYSHNPLVKRLLEDAGIKTDSTKLLERSTYSARHVRDLIRWGNDEWESLVPEGVVKIIKEYKLDERVREIGETRTKR